MNNKDAKRREKRFITTKYIISLCTKDKNNI